MSSRDLERSAEMAGYTFGIVGAYWRSNTLAAYAQMSRGEIEEAMETIQLAIATLTVWDLGQGIAYPVVRKLVDRIVKNKQLFRNTIQAYSDYRNVEFWMTPLELQLQMFSRQNSYKRSGALAMHSKRMSPK